MISAVDVQRAQRPVQSPCQWMQILGFVEEKLLEKVCTLHFQVVNFFDQSEVDSYVTHYQYQVAEGQECSNFLAGHALRSTNRFAALQETGVMGVVCRHEFPLCFINLFHGERIAYSVYLLKKLKQMYPHHTIQLMYDIACILVKHLKANKRADLMNNVEFAVPVFHAYGHVLECQSKFNPRNITGFGLSDGEGVERLWAYLRSFTSMTKEMRPSHRVDVLSDALQYYRQKTTEKIGNLLCKRMEHAIQLQAEATQALTALKEDPLYTFVDDDIERWAEEVKDRLSDDFVPRDQPSSWQENYVCLLDAASIIRIEQKLQAIEVARGISLRWTIDSSEYVETKAISSSKEKCKLRKRMISAARERWFLLKLKSKYAGLNSHQQLTWEEATDLSNELYKGIIFASTEIPSSIKLQAVQQHQRLARAKEEISRLKEEMNSVTEHYILKHKTISERIEELSSSFTGNLFTLGSLCLLKKCLKVTTLKLKTLQCFLEYIPLPELVSALQRMKIEEVVVMDIEDLDVSVRCSEVTLLEDDDEEDDDDDSLDNCGLTGNTEVDYQLPLTMTVSSGIGQQLPPATVTVSSGMGRQFPPATVTVSSGIGRQLPQATVTVSTGMGRQLPQATVTVANTVTNELVNEYMSDESDEEMVMQDWKRNRFLRQTYLDSIRNANDDLGQLLSDLEESAKVKITEREKESTIKPMSYLEIPQEVLKESMHQVELADNRAEKREKLQKLLNSGPYFKIK